MARQADHSRTQIIIALIGLFGVIAAALLANWDKLFPAAPPATVDRTAVGGPAAGGEPPVASVEGYSAAQERALNASTVALEDVAAQIEAANAPPPKANAAAPRE